jgi:N-acyl homoserine lactone hydrolase
VAISKDDIRRVPLGHYTRPTGDPLAGQRIVVSAFLVPHPGGTVLFDTGIGEGEPEFDRHYRVVRRELREGLAALGVGLDEIRLVANCHLHADHCGGNPTFADRTVFVQRAELAAARKDSRLHDPGAGRLHGGDLRGARRGGGDPARSAGGADARPY